MLRCEVIVPAMVGHRNSRAVRRWVARHAVGLALLVFVVICALAGYSYVTAIPASTMDYGRVADEELGTLPGPNAATLYEPALTALTMPAPGADAKVAWERVSFLLLDTIPPDALIRQWLARNAGAFDLSVPAVEVDRCWFAMKIAGGSALARFPRPKLWALADGWGHRAWIAAEAGDLAEARRCYGRSLRVVRHSYQVPSLGHDLEAAAMAECRAHMRWAAICWKYRGALELAPADELTELAAWPDLRAGFRVRELAAADRIQQVYSAGGWGGGHWVPRPTARSFERLYNLRGITRPTRGELLAAIHQRYDQVLVLFDKPPGAAREDRIADMLALLESQAELDRGLSLCDAGRDVVSRYAMRALARAQGLRMAVAAMSRLGSRMQRGERLPESLDELAETRACLNPKAPVAGLGYERFEDRAVGESEFRLYTFGADGVDDGGPAPWNGGYAADDDPVWPVARDLWPGGGDGE